MTLELFKEHIGNLNDFGYDDGKYYVGIFPTSADHLLCCNSMDDDGAVYHSVDDVLNNFRVSGKPFREILPEIDENLL